MTPFTVYYYAMNSVTMSDSPWWLKGMFEVGVRTYNFISYSYQRTGFDNFFNLLNKTEQERVGTPLQCFYIYLDRKGQISDRKVVTFWNVGDGVGGVEGSLAIIGGWIFIFFG